MNLQKMIAELQAERSRLDEAIAALERLSAGKAKRRRARPIRVVSTEPETDELPEPRSAAAKATSRS
jgi:hypothetical protein